jgi:hypothetical protein
MSAFNKKFNKDDLVERAAIAGILNKLHNKLSFTYIHSDNREESVEVPFYYSMSGDERFLMDQFLNEFDTEKAETNYDKVPRGIVVMESTGIRTEAKTNPHVRMEQVVEEFENEGDQVPALKTYSAKFAAIPIQMNINCRIKVASHRDLLLISQLTKKEFYRNSRFFFDYQGLRVPGNLMFPESFDKENPIEYTFDGIDRTQELLISLEAHTFIPDYEEGSRIFAGNIMQNIDSSVVSKNNLNK